MKRMGIVIIALMIGIWLGAVAAEHNMEPVKVEASAGGVQITYANGSGYWYEY